MKPILLILTLILTSLSLQAQQEKRLALIIANGDYEHYSELKNPINDAELISQKLDSLGFEVMKGYNLEYKAEFLDVIDEFGARRERDSFDVAIVYYAGHAIQVENENYLLPTKEFLDFNQGKQLDRKAVKVSEITYWLERKPDQFNILILDACRNNPIPAGTATRNIIQIGDGGLAGIDDISGTLIAFAAKAGNTALDGSGANSPYAVSLSRNMMLENTSINQVLRNVRAEVQQQTDKAQSPDYTDRSTWTREFYFNKGNFFDDFILIDSLLDAEDYFKGLQIVESVLNNDPTNLQGLLKKGRLYYHLENNKLANESIDLAKKIYPNSKEVYLYRASLLANSTEKYDEALKEIDSALQIDPNYIDAYIEQGSVYYSQNKYIEAINSLSKAIDIDSLNEDLYSSRALVFYSMDSIIMAEKDYKKVIELNPEYLEAYYKIGVIKDENGLNADAIIAFEKVLEIDSTNVNAINYIGVIYEKKGMIDSAIETYERGILLEEIHPLAAAQCYSNRARFYQDQEKFELALSDYTKAIALDPINPLRYRYRALYFDALNKENPALIDYSKAIDLDNKNPEIWRDRAWFHYRADHYQDAIEDYKDLLELDSTDIDAINKIGDIYTEQGKLNLAIQTFERGIALEKTDPIGASSCYLRIGLTYRYLEKYQKSIDDLTKSIELHSNNSLGYIQRAITYKYMSENEKALEDYDMAIQGDPTDAENWFSRGAFLFDFMSDYKGAIRDLEKSISLNPSDIDNYIWLGELYFDIEDYAKSIEICLKGLEVDKNDIPGMQLLYEIISESYYATGNIDKVIEYIDMDLALSPDTEITQKKGRIYEYDLNEPYTALNIYTAAISIDSSCYSCWDSRARLYGEKLHNYEMAIKDFKYITTYIDTNDVNELNWIGVYYHRLGEQEKAKEYYNKVIQKYIAGVEFNENDINGGVAWSFTNLGVYNERDNDYVAAQKFYNKAIEIDAQYPDRYYWRGWFYFNCLNNIDLALLDAQKAIDLDPENSKWLLCKANMLEKANRLREAKEVYDLAKSLFPEEQYVQLERARFLGINGQVKSSKKEFKKLQHLKTRNSKYLNYQIEINTKQNNFNEAEKLVYESLNLFPKDTLSRMYLGDLLFHKGQYTASCSHYTYLISMMENNDDYLMYEPHLNQINLSDLYIKQAKSFEKMQDNASICEALKQAIAKLENMYGIYNKKELKSELEEKIQEYCQH